MSEPLVIVGNGMAAARLVDELVKTSLGSYAIAVIGEEPRLAYNRVLLSSVLAGDVAPGEIELKPAAWWRARGVTLLYGERAVAVDAQIRRVRLAGGATIPYSKLVLATGSRAIRLPVPGMGLPGVLTFRDLGDIIESLLPVGEDEAISISMLLERWPSEEKPRRNRLLDSLREGFEAGRWLRKGEGVKGDPYLFWKLPPCPF